MTLVELLVAMPVMGIVGTMAVLLLLATQRQARRADAVGSATRELRHAALVIGSDLRPVQSGEIAAFTDTSIDFDATVAIGTVCDGQSRGARVDVLPTDSADAASLRDIAPVQDGDMVTLWLTAPPPYGAMPWRSLVHGTPVAGGCTGSLLRANAARAVRIPLDDTLPAQVLFGAPVRVTRRTRLHHYRASDGAWYLGRRTRGRTVWDVTQPVAGPFASAARQGLRFTVVDSAGSPLAAPSDMAAAVRIALRAPRANAPGVSDSAFVAVGLRGRNE